MRAQTRIRILYLDHGTKPVGGGQINTLSLIRALDEARFTAVVLSGAENSFTQEVRRLGKEVIIVPLPLALTRLGRWAVKYDPWHLAVYLWHSALTAGRIARFVIRERIDILQPCDSLMRVLCALIRKPLGRPVVCPVMEDFTPSTATRAVRWLVLRTADFILPVSETAAAFFRTGRPTKSTIIVTYTGIDLDQFRSTDAEESQMAKRQQYGDALIIGIVGRLVAIKGHRELFQALAILKETRVSAIRCLVVGDGPDREALEALAAELDLTDEIVFTGFQRDVSKLMCFMDIVAVPSHTEASSRVVLEAGALKVPVVGTRVGGIPEMVRDGETGILVELGDIPALARALEELMDPALRRRMGNAGFNWVRERFSSRAITRQVEDVYVRAYGLRARRLAWFKGIKG